MDLHALSNTHMTQNVLLIVTQETDTFSGHEELSGEFVKRVLMEGYRQKVCSLKEPKTKYIYTFFIVYKYLDTMLFLKRHMFFNLLSIL